MRRLLAFLLSLSVMLTCVGGLSLSVFADGTLQGSGTPDDPYLISSAEDFALIENNRKADYKQTADFTVTTPITGAFMGTYDGDGHTITADISVDLTETKTPIGLFCKVGGDAGNNDWAEIKNLTLRGSVKATNTTNIPYIGGFVGQVTTSCAKLDNLTNYATIDDVGLVTDDNVGGIVGRAYIADVEITNCKNYGKIHGKRYVGGISGFVGQSGSAGIVTNCANFGEVHAEERYAGGISGWCYEAKFDSCYNFGYVHGPYAAGIIAYVSRNITVENCFNAGNVAATNNAREAGLVVDVGKYSVTMKNSYNAQTGLPIYVDTYTTNTSGVDDDTANTFSNLYALDENDTIATVVTKEVLSDKVISDAFVLLADADYRGYRYPQLKNNLIPKNIEIISGSGTSADPYIIANGYQFNYFFGQNADLTTYKGSKYYYIVDDIDLSNIGYLPYNTPQASSFNSFAGRVLGVDFDGNPVQRTIYFGTIGSEENPYNGMPNKEGGTTFYTGAIAGIVGQSTFKNLTLDGTFYIGANYAGGLIGYANGIITIDSVVNEMDIISTGGYLGGIVGQNANAGLQVTNCTNNGNISGTTNVGGIIGGVGRAPQTFKNNKNTGNITCTNTNVGGVVGYYCGNKDADFTMTVDNCINEGEVSSEKGYVGGVVGTAGQYIAGWKANLIIKDSKNSGKVTAANHVGGILGGCSYGTSTNISTIEITNCVNTGEINANNQYIGGIAGSANNSKISYCANHGKLNSTYAENHSYAGGIVGLTKVLQSTGAFGVYNSYNTAEINYLGTRNGGLVGYVWKETADTTGTIADYEVKNSFAIGQLVTTGANKVNGSIYGCVYNAADYENNVATVSGCYTTLPYITTPYRTKASSATVYTEKNISDSYNVSSLTSNESGYSRITEEELIALTDKEGSIFSDTSVWMASENGYPYPQIVGNIYNVKATPVPSQLEVTIVDGRYILTWESKEEPTNGYKVLIDGNQFGDIVAEKSVDITSAVEVQEDKTVIIKVVAIDSTEYESEEIGFCSLFNGGIGTPEEPYVVATKEQLALVKDYPDANFVQDGNIEDVDFMIGVTKANPFTGSYDGNGYSIDVAIVSEASGLLDDNIGTGLFPFISGDAIISNLSITGSVEGHTVNTAAFVGVCLMEGYTLEGLKNYATVTADKKDTAGIVGRAYKKGVIKNCFNYADIEGFASTGGIAAVTNSYVNVTACGNYGDIKGGDYAAGVVAWSYGSVSKSFNVGKIEADTVAGIAAKIQASFNQSGAPQYMAIISDCYNLGTLEGSVASYGISMRAIGKEASYSIRGCYNAVDADYPISDLTDEFVNEFNTTYSKTTGVTDSFFLTADESTVSVNAGATKVTTLTDLENIAFTTTAYAKSGDLKYPQLKDNKLDADKDDIDFVIISADLEETEGYLKGFRKSSYVKKGDDIVLVVLADDFHSVETFLNEGSLGIFTERKELLINISRDSLVSAESAELEVSVPENMTTGNEIFASSNDSITVDDKEYTRFAIVAGKVSKASGLMVKEFGILINRADEDFTLETATKKAPANNGKINDNGWYGILIHSTDAEKGLKDGMTYYTRPYVVYADKDGVEYNVYGAVQSFVLDAVE